MEDKKKKQSLIPSIMFLTLACLLIFQADKTIAAVSYFIGAILLLLGLVGMISFFRKTEDVVFLAYGLVATVAGILLILNPKFIATIIPFVIGIGIIVSSAIKLQEVLDLKKIGLRNWQPSVIIALFEMICGVLIVFNPFGTAVTLLKLAGILLLIFGILDLLNNISINNGLNDDKSKIKEAKLIEEKSIDIMESNNDR